MPSALVLGCGENVWTDTLAAARLFKPDAIVAVKDMIYKFPLRVDYGVSLHPDRTPKYLKARREKGWNTDFEVWAHRMYDSAGGPHRTTTDWQGSSGLLAVKVAMEEGFGCIVVAGTPMDPKFGHVARKKDWHSAQIFRRGWQIHLPELTQICRSMSGWTQQLVGMPTVDWLREKGAAKPDPKWIEKLETAIGREQHGENQSSLRKAG